MPGLVSNSPDSLFINTQFIEWHGLVTRQTRCFPPLVMSARLIDTEMTKGCLCLAKYIVCLELVSIKCQYKKTPNRLTSLCLSINNIYCINTNWHIVNYTRPMIRLTPSILSLGIDETKVFNPPNGFFVCLTLGSSTYEYTRPVKHRESILRLWQYCVFKISSTHLAKSTKDISMTTYPKYKYLRLETNSENSVVYNTYVDQIAKKKYELCDCMVCRITH